MRNQNQRSGLVGAIDALSEAVGSVARTSLTGVRRGLDSDGDSNPSSPPPSSGQTQQPTQRAAKQSGSLADAIGALSDAVGDVVRTSLTGVRRGLDSGGDSNPSSPPPSSGQTQQPVQQAAGDASTDPRDQKPLPTLPFFALLDLATETTRVFENALRRLTGAWPLSQDSEQLATPYGPPLVNIGNRAYPPQPYVLKNCNIDAFWAEGDLDKLQSLCDSQFTIPTGGAVRYRVFTSKLVVFFAEIGGMESSDEDHPVSISERELTICAVAVRERPLLPQLVFVPLFVFVDSGVAQAAGREIYGFPKQQAKFDNLQRDGDSLTSLVVKALVGRQPGSSEEEWKQVLALTGSGKLVSDWLQEGRDIHRQLLWNFSKLEKGNRASPFFKRLERLVDFTVIRMALLKQLPSAEDGRRASYQSIVETAMAIKSLDVKKIDGDYKLEVTDYPWLELGETLGLKFSGPLTPTIRLNLNIALSNACEIWRADASRGDLAPFL